MIIQSMPLTGIVYRFNFEAAFWVKKKQNKTLSILFHIYDITDACDWPAVL